MGFVIFSLAFYDKIMFWKVYGVLIVMAAIVPGVIVHSAFAYGLQRQVEFRIQDLETTYAMQEHETALVELNNLAEYLSYWEEEGILDEEILAEADVLRSTFAEGKYAEVRVDGLVERVILKIEERERQIAAAQVLVDAFKKEIADAKKLGVNVVEIEKQVVVLEEKIEQGAYGEVAGLLTTQKDALVKAVEVKKVADEAAKKLAATRVVAAAPVGVQSNGGISYERKVVSTQKGGFTTDILRVDLARAWARTFVAHDGDCARDCAVKPLAGYVGENGGVAGINGTYFCPPDYAHCAERKNSFDLLVFDYARKKYSNSGNNQYSTNPLVNFYSGRANLYGAASGFGRDTGANGVISNFPLLISNGTIVGGETGKGTRGAIGFNGSIVWAVQVRSASFQDTAFVLQALGANNAMNLDGGGSSALYFNGGYRVGPGRALPNAIVFGN